MNNRNPGCCTAPMPKGTWEAQTAACTPCRESSDTSCACRKACFPVNTSVAMAYVPFQQSGEVYPHERALARGTIFACLDKPFLKGCCR